MKVKSEEGLRRLISIGGQMSNVCFNCAQRSDLTDGQRDMLDTLWRQWDATLRVTFAPTKASKPKRKKAKR